MLAQAHGPLVTLVLVVAAVAAVAVRRDADFGCAQVVGSHHGTCGRWMDRFVIRAIICLCFSTKSDA